jgi:hypothetical protein
MYLQYLPNLPAVITSVLSPLQVPPAIVHEWADGPDPVLMRRICDSVDEKEQASKFLTMKEVGATSGAALDTTLGVSAFKQGHFVANWKRRWFFCIKPTRAGDPILIDFYASEESQVAGGKKKGTILVHSASSNAQLLDSPETKATMMVVVIDKTGKKYKLRTMSNRESAKLVQFLSEVEVADDSTDSSSGDDEELDKDGSKGKPVTRQPGAVKPSRTLPAIPANTNPTKSLDEELEDRKVLYTCVIHCACVCDTLCMCVIHCACVWYTVHVCDERVCARVCG